eukprot:2052617-Alexandrium_andersonii.AAC.2
MPWRLAFPNSSSSRSMGASAGCSPRRLKGCRVSCWPEELAPFSKAAKADTRPGDFCREGGTSLASGWEAGGKSAR